MGDMTLLQAWHTYTKHSTSPQNFIDISLYWMVGAALQRRVWIGSHLEPILGSMYCVLCGEPGVGKGMINLVSDLMKYHKMEMPKSDNKIAQELNKLRAKGGSVETLQMLEDAKRAMEEVKDYNKKAIKEIPLMFPVGADSTTFQSIVEQHAAANRVYHIGQPHIIAPSGSYTYHSINFIVEETSSLFNKNAELIVQYLLSAFNAQDYTYKTKHFGTDIIKKCSLALLGGTTPDFMAHAFSDQLLGEGFSSRTLFTYAAKPRYWGWERPELEIDQLKAREYILLRLKQLSKLFGQCRYTPEAREFMDAHFKGKEPTRLNRDNRLRHYYARKNLHVQKLAMCIHFADSDELLIDQWALIESMKMLEKIELTMHYALSIKGANPLGDLQRKILRWMVAEVEPKTFVDIYVNFVDDATEVDIEEALNFLIYSNKIDKDGTHYIVKKKE